MKITDIRVENYQRVTFADIRVGAPILFLAGANEAGKTSIADAVYHAVCDKARRVELKKDFAGLVHDGAKKGAVTIVTADSVPTGVTNEDSEPGTLTLSVPTGKRACNVTPHPLMPLLLDASRFPHMSHDERRQIALSLHPVKLSGKVILQKLLDKGANPEKAREIGAVLLAGFPAANAEAKSKASEARGAWKQLTGENYGNKKAPEWKAAKPTYDEQAIGVLREQIPGLEHEHHDAVLALGTLTGAKTAAQQQASRRAELQAVIERKPRAKAKLETDLEQLAEWEQKVARAKAAIGTGPDPTPCPHCGGLLDVVNGKLHQHAPASEEAAKYKALLPSYEDSLAKVQSFVTHDRNEMLTIEGAEARLAELDKSPAVAPSSEEVHAAEQKVQQAKSALDSARELLRTNEEFKRRAERADDDTTKALALHNDVEQWEAIAELLSPSGIPSDLMADALAPLHKRLAQTAQITGWEPVSLDAEMNILIGKRPYSLASKSAQWRAQAALVEAIAHVSRARTFMLDEVDILDAHNRLAFLKWMHAIAADIDTAIIIGTFKQAPSCPGTFNVVWVEGGLAPAGIVDAEIREAA